MDLYFDTVWDKLIENWEAQPRYIVVPYFTCDNGLIFDEDDVLIVDASSGAIKFGQTDANALRRAYEAGANVFSCDNLHAKVYILGKTVFVGSANSSMSSRNSLIECLASSNDPHAVSEAVGFVLALQKQSKKVDEEFLKYIEEISVAKRPPSSLHRKKPVVVPRTRCWLLGLHEAKYPGNEEKIKDENLEVENSLDDEDEQVDWFWWPLNNSKFIREASVGDLFIDIWRSDKDKDTRNVIIYRHARICRITKEDGVNAKVFHAAWPNDYEETALEWDEFCSICKRAGLSSRLSLNSCRGIPGKISKVIHQLWKN